MSKWLRAFVGLLILSLLVYLFDFNQVLNEFKNIDISWLYLVVLAILASTFLGAIAMFLIVSRNSEITFSKFLPIYWISWSFGLIVPGQIGEIASISILLKRLGFAWSIILARSLVDKLITLFLIVSIASFSIINTIKISQINHGLIISAIAFILTIFFILVFGNNKTINILRNKKSKLINFIRGVVNDVGEIFSTYPERVIANIVLTVIKISLIGSAYWLMFISLGATEISVWDVIPLVAASSLVAYIPISLNGVGTVELAGIFLFSSIGLSEPTVLAAFLLLRILVFALAWLPTSILLFVNK